MSKTTMILHVEGKAAICLCQNRPRVGQGPAISSEGSNAVPSFDATKKE